MLSWVAIYGTSKEVKLLDRRLGLLHLLILFIVLAYVIGMRLIIEKGYQSMELSHGTVAVTLSHNPNISAYMVTNGVVSAADEADLVQPLKEGAALFLATTRATTPMQKLGNCTDPSTSCRHDADCSVGGHTDPPLSYGICDESSGYCITQGWCPKPYTAGANTQVSQLDGIEHLAITLIGTIDFPRLGGKNNWMTTEDGRNAKVTWSLPTVLKRGGVDQVCARGRGDGNGGRLQPFATSTLNVGFPCASHPPLTPPHSTPTHPHARASVSHRPSPGGRRQLILSPRRDPRTRPPFPHTTCRLLPGGGDCQWRRALARAQVVVPAGPRLQGVPPGTQGVRHRQGGGVLQ